MGHPMGHPMGRCGAEDEEHVFWDLSLYLSLSVSLSLCLSLSRICGIPGKLGVLITANWDS